MARVLLVSGALASFELVPRCRLTILFGNRDRAGRRSLSAEIVRLARSQGLAGATLFEAKEGYGRSGRLHRERLLSDDRPLSLVIVDRSEVLDAFVKRVGPLLGDATVFSRDVAVVRRAQGRAG